MPGERPCDHDDDRDQEDDDRDAVHAVHEEEIGTAGRVRIALLEEEILLYLVPDTHGKMLVVLKIQPLIGRNSLVGYICNP